MSDDLIGGAAAAVAAFEQATASEAPRIAFPSDDEVLLPGSGKTAKVRELTGADEEEMGKAAAYNGLNKYLNVILRNGTVSIDDEEVSAKDIDNLLLGDRDALLLAIRRVTFGDEVELEGISCNCGEFFDISFTVDDIEVKYLDGTAEREVPLRKGGKALIRLATGADQTAMAEMDTINGAEQNTLLLSRVVQAIVDKDGETHPVGGRIQFVRDRLGIADRRAILRELVNNQPGPLLDKFSVEHSCGNSVTVPLGMMDLFQGF